MLETNWNFGCLSRIVISSLIFYVGHVFYLD